LLAGGLEKELAALSGPAHDSAFIAAAFERVLGRLPTHDETTACADYLSEGAKKLANLSGLARFPSGLAAAVPPSNDPRQRARENLVHVLFNHNDFVTVR
jgi:hypothetical protein